MGSDLQKYWLPITVAGIWTIIWKGFALWKAARQDDKAWYVALLIINSLGLLEIFYIFIFSNRKPKPKQQD